MHRTVMIVALMVLGGDRLSAQGRMPMVGDTVRLTKRQPCFDVFRLFSCKRWPVRGTVRGLSLDAIHIRIARPRTGLLATATTGVYRDTLVHWTPYSSTDLALLTGHRKRGTQALIGASIGGAAGLVLAESQRLLCFFCSEEEVAQAVRFGRLGFAPALTVLGAALGYFNETERWRSVPRTWIAVKPLVRREGHVRYYGLVLTTTLPRRR